MDFVNITPEYYEFVRKLRTDPRVASGFLQEVDISPDDQIRYMRKHGGSYFVCLLLGEPVGYAGVVDNDIRFCTHPYYQGMGVGTFMLDNLRQYFPEATGRIKKENTASQKAFDKCGIPYTLI
jgi:RimJ/RimL family protein N-acetyltransferase